MPWPGADAADVLVPRARVGYWWQRLVEAGARPAGTWAFEAMRVTALRPRVGMDTDERTIPAEVGWIGTAVHLDKGCYRGQESVARVYNLGRPPRQLVLLHLDGSVDGRPAPGDDVTAGGRAVGRVGTVVEHHELGPIALALLKRAVPVETELVAGPCAAAVGPGFGTGAGAGTGRARRGRPAARAVSVSGRLVAVCTVHEVLPDPGRKGATGVDKRPRRGPVEISATGLAGDVVCDEVHHGGRDQAVYAYAVEDAKRWATELGQPVPPGRFGENLSIEGIAVSDAVVGERWAVGSTLLEVTLPRTPCETFARRVEQPRWVRRFAERGDTGAYLRVVEPGAVTAGDRVEVVHRPAHGVTVREVFRGDDPHRLARLLAEGLDVPPKAVAKAEKLVARDTIGWVPCGPFPCSSLCQQARRQSGSIT